MSFEPKYVSQRDRVNEVYAQIVEAIKGIRFGSVEIIIHDGQVVQIERKEKVRFEVNKS